MTGKERVKKANLTRRLLTNVFAVTAIVILGVAFLVSLFAQWVAPFDPNLPNLGATHVPPFLSEHILGTDSIGRDVLSRLIWGGRVTFAAAAVAASMAVLSGVPAGLLAGYWGGRFDTAATWLMNINIALPGIIIILAVRAAVGPSIFVLMTVLGVLVSPPLFRVTRSCVAAVRNENYVDAARVLGLSDWRIIGRHILYAVRAPVIVQVALVAGISILVQSGLEFLGLGDIKRTSWGSMLNDGFRNVYNNPVLMLWPSLAIAGTVGLLAVFGNALRDALEESGLTVADGEATQVLAESRDERSNGPADSRNETQGSHLLLCVRNLSVTYPLSAGVGRRVVDRVSFAVARGEVLGIVGESGSGKTQTAFAILGLLPPEARVNADELVFDGIDLRPSNQAIAGRHRALLGKRIAYVPQEPTANLDPAFRVGSQLVRPLVQVLGLDKRTAKSRAVELLSLVGIDDPRRVYDSYPHQISGGMAQRVLIAGAISCEPDLLVADEPTTALDVTVQADILDLLRDLQSRMGMGLILVSHNMGVVADICDRVVVMREAKVVEARAVRDVLLNPEHEYTKRLLSALLVNKTPRTFLNPVEHAKS